MINCSYRNNVFLEGGRGIFGEQGDNGLPGPKGMTGYPGLSGVPGKTGPKSSSRGYYFTRHSQNTSIPECPQGTRVLWSGFSLLYILGHDKSHGQDLGSPGSCLRRFSSIPYLVCDSNQCRYVVENDYSYWLSTDAERPISNTPIVGLDIQRFVSRCSVCEANTQVISVHSQSMFLPECPNNWKPLWEGYSFFMV